MIFVLNCVISSGLALVGMILVRASLITMNSIQTLLNENRTTSEIVRLGEKQ